ncbi:MAG TPA: heme-binding domain-containing protein [Bacteroidales bacterium]|nr:heme-binding domain-containing protein [Bacteroidales bacterium]
MKRNSSVLIIMVVLIGFFLLQGNLPVPGNEIQGSFYKSDVKTVIDNKCYGCHSVKGKSQDAKDALMWDSLPGISTRKIVATLDEVIEVLEKNDMPPEETVKKFPQMALAEDEKKILLSWAKAKADSLIN